MGNAYDKMEDRLCLGDKDVYSTEYNSPALYTRFSAIVTALTDEEVDRWKIREKIATSGCQWLHVPLDDDEAVDASQYFQQVFDFIEAALTRGDQVLVHCAAGISRSVTLMVAYLMQKHDWSRKEALQHVISRRRIADPNDGFMRQLEEFEAVLGMLKLHGDCKGNNNHNHNNHNHNNHNRFTDPIPTFAGKPPTESEWAVIEKLMSQCETDQRNPLQ